MPPASGSLNWRDPNSVTFILVLRKRYAHQGPANHFLPSAAFCQGCEVYVIEIAGMGARAELISVTRRTATAAQVDNLTLGTI